MCKGKSSIIFLKFLSMPVQLLSVLQFYWGLAENVVVWSNLFWNSPDHSVHIWHNETKMTQQINTTKTMMLQTGNCETKMSTNCHQEVEQAYRDWTNHRVYMQCWWQSVGNTSLWMMKVHTQQAEIMVTSDVVDINESILESLLSLDEPLVVTLLCGQTCLVDTELSTTFVNGTVKKIDLQIEDVIVEL